MADMPLEVFTLGAQAVVFKPYNFITLLKEVEGVVQKFEGPLNIFKEVEINNLAGAVR